MKNKLINRYCRAVARAIPLRGAEKKAYLQTIRTEAEAIVSEAPGIGFDGLCSRFGSPREQAKAFFEELSGEQIQKLFRTRRTVLMIAVSLAVIMFVGFWGTMASVFLTYANGDSYSVITETEIERGEVPENEWILGE